MTAPTAKAAEFMAANDASPVVVGVAIEQDPREPARGCRYQLKNGLRFTLGVAVCRALPEGYPRWDLPS